MGTITVFNHITLDGVMQAPGRPDEDRRGGFEHGGWAAARMDSVTGAVGAKGMANPRGGGLILGRRTYEQFFDFWPKQADNPFTPALNRSAKYVASRTLREPLPWENSTLLHGDAADAIAELKKSSDQDFTILGSGDLIRSLVPRRLIDRFILFIHPVVLGTGQRMFANAGDATNLRLADSQVSTTGVLIATYELAEDTENRYHAGQH